MTRRRSPAGAGWRANVFVPKGDWISWTRRKKEAGGYAAGFLFKLKTRSRCSGARGIHQRDNIVGRKRRGPLLLGTRRGIPPAGHADDKVATRRRRVRFTRQYGRRSEID